MKTLVDFPRPRHPEDHEPDLGVVLWSVFDDVVGLWQLGDSDGVPVHVEVAP